MAFDYKNSITKDGTFPSSGVHPEISVENADLVSQPPNWARTVYTRRQYSPLAMFTHTKKETVSSDYFLGGYGKYDDTIFFYNMASQVFSAGAMPSFLTKEKYADGYSKMNTGFLTPQKSIMPKILVPSQKIVDNGIARTIYEGVINWRIDDEKMASTTPEDAHKMVILKGNGEEKFKRTATLDPNNIFLTQMQDIDPSKFVGSGAFQFVVCFFDVDMTGNAAKLEAGETASDDLDDKIQPYVTLEIGDLNIIIESDGKCTGSWKSDEKNSCVINLISGSGEECIPQAKLSADESKVYVLSVYPCWNGVVIQSGVQNAENLATTSAAFIPKWKKASIFDFMEKVRIGNQFVVFSPEDPAPMVVKMISEDGKMDVTPRLGDAGSVFTFTATNCECRIAFSPLFFHNKLDFEHVIRGSLSTNDFTYKYTAYPIWTGNGTTYSLQSNDGIDFTDTGAEGGLEFTRLFKIRNIMAPQEDGIYQRNAGEIFGCIVGMTETKTTNVTNSSGIYSNGLSGWQDFITSVTTSNSLEASSASITFDKFGLTGDQDSLLQQSVGGVSISVKGCYNTNGADHNDSAREEVLFKGYTWTAQENKSNTGADVTVSLVGVEKRLEDHFLINPPIFDGYSFGQVVQYICGNAGVKYNLTNAESDIPLIISTDINVAIYNWTTGMDARSALEQICQDTAHRYTPINGELFFYKLNSDGSPAYTGYDWTSFNNENIDRIDTTPDFDNIRNQVVLIAMRKPETGKGKSFADDWPVFPITSLINNTTIPVIPWQKAICYTLPGFMSEKELDLIGENIARSSRKYELLGTTTIPGANIKPLDLFMTDYIVTDVTQNVDLSNKTWTTSLGFMRK